MDLNSFDYPIITKSKLNETDYNQMMDKFNKLNEVYSSNLEKSDINILEKKYSIIDSKEEDLMYFIDIAKSDLTLTRNNIEEINSQLKSNDDLLNDLNNLKKSMNETNKIYKNILSKAYFIEYEMKNKTKLPENFYSTELVNLFELSKSEIEIKNEILKEELFKHIDKISKFKKLLIKASPDLKIGNICGVCITNKINICMNPCGHTFCNSCADKMNNCGMCRANISSKIKLFLDDNDNGKNDEYIEAFLGFNNNRYTNLENYLEV